MAFGCLGQKVLGVKAVLYAGLGEDVFPFALKLFPLAHVPVISSHDTHLSAVMDAGFVEVAGEHNHNLLMSISWMDKGSQFMSSRLTEAHQGYTLVSRG